MKYHYILPVLKSILACLSLMMAILLPLNVHAQSETIAIWIFDEQEGLYPSKVLHDVGPNTYIMTLGRSGYIVPGKFGNALKIGEPRHIDFPEEDVAEKTGLEHYPIPEGRTIVPMVWHNAFHAALMTSGEPQIRTQVDFPQATATGLNLGDENWTVEFWLKPYERIEGEGVVFEIGTGPRGENNKITRLSFDPDNAGFVFFNEPGGATVHIPTDMNALDHNNMQWVHLAFVHDAQSGQITHYVNGNSQPLPPVASIKKLETGNEDYFTLGKNAVWEQTLMAEIDEIRFSRGMVYSRSFSPPGSFVEEYLGPEPEYNLVKGPELLFSPDRHNDEVVNLGLRKHLFIDDELIESSENITFTVNPPRVAEQVMRVTRETLDFRKHLDVIEDEDGRIRIYNALVDDHLGVWVSDDGINFEALETGSNYKGVNNLVIMDIDGDGTMFIDENAPPHRRWNYVSGYKRRGTYMFTSPDGIRFTRDKMALLPFRTATQNDMFYDDQRQLYIGYWRSGFPRTVANETQREFVMSEAINPVPPMPFTPVTAEYTHEVAKTKRLSAIIPWYMDNGPLTPGKFGIEFPTVFAPDDEIDGPSAGIYNPKADKYPWAPDVYLAFPVFYFHYYEEPAGRQHHVETRGGGPTETQFAASRDGINWKRYPRPTYVGIGQFGDLDAKQNYIAKGMIHRGHEIWQYVFMDADYHTSATPRTRDRGVYRLVQRYDGFVSIDSPYEKYGSIVTRPIRLEGSKLILNINTDAHGYAIVSLLDENDQPIPGFGSEESVFINGNHIDIEAEWIGTGSDLSSLKGRNIKVRIDMRGSKLYSMQLTD
ncbi:MAG: LamG-like jellyroll fold domain-containing protein [Cyclonatronaceae bacterium]